MKNVEFSLPVLTSVVQNPLLVYTFKFKALKAGNAKIGFSYGRPWEKDTPSADTKTVSVVVDGSNEEWSEAH